MAQADKSRTKFPTAMVCLGLLSVGAIVTGAVNAQVEADDTRIIRIELEKHSKSLKLQADLNALITQQLLGNKDSDQLAKQLREFMQNARR